MLFITLVYLTVFVCATACMYNLKRGEKVSQNFSLKSQFPTMKVLKVMERLDLSWHDVFILVALLELSWWTMYACVDGADTIIRMSLGPIQYHSFLLLQKVVSFVKLIMTGLCIWYGTVFRGQVLWLRIYLTSGILIDATLIITWIFIAIEEKWPLAPSNIFGLHYLLTFISLRLIVYWIIFRFMHEIFVAPFGTHTIGTTNGSNSVVGIPDQGRSVQSGNNLVFFGKGVWAVVEYYRIEVERTCMMALVWDVLWNLSIIVTQELPELIFDVIFIGLFGSLPLYIPTENLVLRLIRALVSMTGVYLVILKIPKYIKYWLISYWTLIVANMIYFCYFAATELDDETTVAIFVLCAAFFGSNFAKILVSHCVVRFYIHLNSSSTMLISESG